MFGQIVHEIGGLQAVEQLQPQQIVELCSSGTWGAASTGDDNLHTHPMDTKAVKALGTIMRDSEESAGTFSDAVSYLSHRYGKDEDGVWRCWYDNGAKLFHRVGVLLSASWKDRTEVERSKILDAVAGQRFVLRHTTELHDVYVRLVQALCPELVVPEPCDTGEA